MVQSEHSHKKIKQPPEIKPVKFNKHPEKK